MYFRRIVTTLFTRYQRDNGILNKKIINRQPMKVVSGLNHCEYRRPNFSQPQPLKSIQNPFDLNNSVFSKYPTSYALNLKNKFQNIKLKGTGDPITNTESFKKVANQALSGGTKRKNENIEREKYLNWLTNESLNDRIKSLEDAMISFIALYMPIQIRQTVVLDVNSVNFSKMTKRIRYPFDTLHVGYRRIVTYKKCIFFLGYDDYKFERDYMRNRPMTKWKIYLFLYAFSATLILMTHIHYG